MKKEPTRTVDKKPYLVQFIGVNRETGIEMSPMSRVEMNGYDGWLDAFAKPLGYRRKQAE